MLHLHRRTAIAGACTVVVTAGLLPLTTAQAHSQGRRAEKAKVGHVLLLSVDGLHQSDLASYVHAHPTSALARLVDRGTSYTHALTPVPSDSFPGMVAQVTGGNPGTTGIYYDDSYNHALLPAGTTSCKGVAPGTEVTYFEALDKDPNSLDAGQGLAGLPGSILAMTGQPRDVINPALLPVDPRTCTPVYPHSYLKVNTVFEVLRAHGLRTAWSDKHAAYDILQGPSGNGIQDLFTPEINSQADGLPAGQDWTKDNAKTQQYDGYKVQAVLNEIDGYDHSRSTKVGMPALLGMNFQSVSTAQKLPVSGGQPGGYQANGTPGPVLTGALNFVDNQVSAMVAELKARHELDDTTIILSAKHGQSPVDAERTDPHPRRADHRRPERSMDRRPPRRRPTRGPVHQRRRHDHVALRPVPGRCRLRQGLPAGTQRNRQRHQRQAQGVHRLRPDDGLRRQARCGLLRHPRG